jgi:hypothetical protein
MLLAISKLDDILWGYLGVFIENLLTDFCLLGGIVWLIVAIIKRRHIGLALIWVLAFQPVFIAPTAMYILGYKLRISSRVDVPAVMAWAAKYTFKLPAMKMDANSPEFNLHATETVDPLELPECLRGLGFVNIGRDRTVYVKSGGGFSSVQGVVIGAGAANIPDVFALFRSPNQRLSICKDAYVWVDTAD